MEKNAAARGGLSAWRAVKSMSMSGSLDAGAPRDPVKLAMLYRRSNTDRKAQARKALLHGGEPAAEKAVQLPFVLELERPRKSRLEIRFQGQTAVQVFDGTEGWKVRPFLGRREVEPYSAEELQQALQQADLDGPLLDHAAKGNKVEFVGTEPVEGREAYKVKVTPEKGEPRLVWVDKQTFLDVKIDGTRRMDGKPRQVWTALRDYRAEGGLMVPHLLETTVEGVAGSEKIVVEHVTLNPELADARFAKPDLAKLSQGTEVPGVPPVRQGAPGSESPREALMHFLVNPVVAAVEPVVTRILGPAPAPAPREAAAAEPPDPHAHHHEMASAMKRASRSTAEVTLPQVTLVRDDGKAVSLPEELDDGRPVVLNFIFTTCTTVCPVMSQTFAQLQDKLGEGRDQVHMVSISIDPEQDTPPRLAEYARKFHAGPQWRHYTGSTQASVAAQRAFEAYRGDKMDHTPVTFLRAGSGRRWVRIDGFASSDELASELRGLLAAP